MRYLLLLCAIATLSGCGVVNGVRRSLENTLIFNAGQAGSSAGGALFTDEGAEPVGLSEIE